MTFDEALAFWYGRIDYERRQPRPGDLKLDRMRSLLRRLGDPHLRLRIVHISGTKGKGSTAAMLANVLAGAGFRTGLFTSPHLSDISERIQVNGVPIARAETAARMTEVAKAVQALDNEGDLSRVPTFFEIITALGFLHFDCRRVDVAVLEVGLGGRFDSTNVCDPLLSIITNISYDHMAILGNTIGEIAYQKAGIVKHRVPVVTTADDPAAVAVIEQVAKEHRSPLFAIGRDFRCESGCGRPGPTNVSITTRKQVWGPLSLNLLGSHQGINAAGVVMAVEVLRQRGLHISDRAVVNGLRTVDWPGRMEFISIDPAIIVDCAHNVASAKALVDTLSSSVPIAGRKHLIFAASTDKQIAQMLDILVPYFDEVHLTRYESNPRSADPNVVAKMLGDRAGVFVYASPEDAWQAVQSRLAARDGVVIAGSVFLAGELRPRILATAEPLGRCVRQGWH